MSTITITPRTLQPITLSAARTHLRVDAFDEDDLISVLIAAATDDAETLMQRSVMPTTKQLTLDRFDGDITLPPVTSIVSIQYLASDGALMTLDPAAYVLAASSGYGARVAPAFGTLWPATRATPEAVRVQFIGGWPSAAAVPAAITAWIKMRVGSLYATREGWSTDKINANEFIDRMLDGYKVYK